MPEQALDGIPLELVYWCSEDRPSEFPCTALLGVAKATNSLSRFSMCLCVPLGHVECVGMSERVLWYITL